MASIIALKGQKLLPQTYYLSRIRELERFVEDPPTEGEVIFLPANELTRIRRKRREWLQGNRKLLAISSQNLINSHSRKE